MKTTKPPAERHRRMLARTAVVGVGALATLWLTMAVTIAGVFGERLPRMTLQWAWFDAKARAELASAELRGGVHPADVRRAQDLATGALMRDSTTVAAARVLGLIAAREGDERRARRLFDYAAVLSRRDFPTRLWMIQDSLVRGDVRAALRHFDVALQTSRGAADTLFPILIAASADPEIARLLRERLLHKPEWWRPFVGNLVSQGLNTDSVVYIARSLLDPGIPEERHILRQLLQRLVSGGRFEQAKLIYESATGAPSDQVLVIGGSFEEDDLLPPFEWDLADEPDLYAIRQRQQGSGYALSFHSGNGRGGEVARQLLLLEPGQYTLSALVGNISSDYLSRPSILLRCATQNGVGTSILEIKLPAAGAAGNRISAMFSVPKPHCPAQWISLKARSDLNGSDKQASWVDDIAIKPSR